MVCSTLLQSVAKSTGSHDSIGRHSTLARASAVDEKHDADLIASLLLPQAELTHKPISAIAKETIHCPVGCHALGADMLAARSQTQITKQVGQKTLLAMLRCTCRPLARERLKPGTRRSTSTLYARTFVEANQ